MFGYVQIEGVFLILSLLEWIFIHVALDLVQCGTLSGILFILPLSVPNAVSDLG